MNFLKKSIILFVLFTSFSFALERSDIKSEMTNKMDQVLIVLENKKLTVNEKNDRIIPIMDEVFDYEIMAKIALGKNLKKIKSKSQLNEFIKAFEEKLKKSYNDKLHLYNDQKVDILELSEYKKSRLQLKTKLIGTDETYDINYNFYENRKNKQWYIYDVELIGVSILQTYRQQFDGLLANKTIEEVIEDLKK